MVFLRGVISITKCRTCCSVASASTFHLSSGKHFLGSKYINPTFCIPIRHLKKEVKSTNTIVAQYKLDRVPTHFDVIYASSLRHWIGVSRIGTHIFAAGILGLIIYKLPTMALESLPSLEGAFVCVAPLMSIAFIIALNYLARPMVTRIYHDPDSDQFICVRRNFLGRLKQIHYVLQDISLQKVKSKATEESWDSVTLNIKNTSVFLLSSDFTDLTYYRWHVQGQKFQRTSTLAKQQLY